MRDSRTYQLSSPHWIHAIGLFLLALQPGCAQLGNVSQPSRKPSPHQLAAGRTTAKLTSQNEGDIQVAVAHSAEKRGATKLAMQTYRKAIETDDRNPHGYYRLALLHDKSGDGQEAVRLYQEALTRAPNSPEIHCDLGYSYYLQGQWPSAERHLREAIRLRADFPRANNNLAMLLARQGRVDDAMVEFSRAGITEEEAHSNTAVALLIDGNTAAARTHLERASQLQKTPSSEEFIQLCNFVQAADDAARQANARPAAPAHFRGEFSEPPTGMRSLPPRPLR